MICDNVKEEMISENNGKEEDESGGLFCSLYKPDVLKFGTGPYPTIVSVYGGKLFLNFFCKILQKFVSGVV